METFTVASCRATGKPSSHATLIKLHRLPSILPKALASIHVRKRLYFHEMTTCLTAQVVVKKGAGYGDDDHGKSVY
jgi:hypothetical protein